MKRYVLTILCGLFWVAIHTNAQVTYRGVAQKKDTNKKSANAKQSAEKNAASKKQDPKNNVSKKTSGGGSAKSVAEKKVADKKAPSKKPDPARKEGMLRVMFFPKLLLANIRVDFTGFQTNLKNFVPTNVVFRLVKTNKPNVKVKDYATRIGRVIPSTKVTSKLEIVTPKYMPPGYYDIYVVDASKRMVLINKMVLVAGISNTQQSFFASVVNGVINTYPLLTIIGYGFGVSSPTNYVYLDNMRLSTVLSWNDSVIKLTVPYWINTGKVYAVSLRNNKGVEIPQKNTDPTLRVNFIYKGIRDNYFSADLNAEDLSRFVSATSGKSDDLAANKSSKTNPKSVNKQVAEKKNIENMESVSSKSKKMSLGTTMKENANQYLTILQIKGLGFGNKRNDSKVFLNSTECKDVVAWSDSLITVKTTSVRPGKYVSKIFLHPNDRWKKNVFVSRDSFHVWGRIPYKLSRIVGSCYAVSLRKSGMPAEQVQQKKSSYIYTLPQDARAELALYDVDGKNLYAKFFSSDKVQSKGRYKITYSSSDLTAGKYLLIFTVNKDKFMKVFHPIVVR